MIYIFIVVYASRVRNMVRNLGLGIGIAFNIIRLLGLGF